MFQPDGPGVDPNIEPEINPVPQGPPKTCMVFGDPHVMTFDGNRADYYTPGEYWIVKSSTVKIQGKYAPTRMTNGLSVTNEIAISGSFINNGKLIVPSTASPGTGRPCNKVLQTWEPTGEAQILRLPLHTTAKARSCRTAGWARRSTSCIFNCLLVWS